MSDVDLKICVVGPSDSGKSFLTKLIGQQPASIGTYSSTKAVRIQEASIYIDLEQVLVQFWDCSGHPDYKKYWRILSKGSDGVLMVCNPSTMDPPSMERVMKCFCEINKLDEKQCLLAILLVDQDQEPSGSLAFEGKLKDVPQVKIKIDTSELDQASKIIIKSIKPFLKSTA